MGFYENIGLPDRAKIDRVIHKTDFYRNAGLSSADKKQFEAIEKIRWLYAMKMENTNIQPYKDEIRDYPEIEVIEVKLRGEKKLDRLAEIIMRAIPYPMLLVFNLDDKYQLWMGKLRQNQLDSTGMVLESTEHTDWLDCQKEFWKKLDMTKISAMDFCALYEAWFDTISKSHLEQVNIIDDKMTGDEARAIKERLDGIEKQITSLRSKLKRESQSNRKIELNMQIQNLKKEKKKILEQGSREDD